MSVFRRKTTSGLTEEYHYKFMKAGKVYFGVCEGCTDKDSAERYEQDIRNKATMLAQQKSVKALVENFRDELQGGEKIPLKKAFALAMKKPSRKPISEKQAGSKQARFEDFVCYVADNHPDVKYLHQVTRSIAEAYISYIRENGRWNKQIISPTGNYVSKHTQLSGSTVNRSLEELRSVFSVLSRDANMLENPFADIAPAAETKEPREAFTEDELELILKEAPPFIRSIFVVGFFTAFREEDIATLKWSDVRFDEGIIRRKLIKTQHSSGAIVEVPIMPPLRDFLMSQKGNDPVYVLPEHAKMYHDNPTGISYRVKKFLEGLGIQTTKRVAGRTRAISVRDVHSLRHTFCYFAGVAGIPLVVVQSIVGHMTKEMTEHYTAHADIKTKREKMAMLPNLSALTGEAMRKPLTEQIRRRILSAVATADYDTLKKVEAILLPPQEHPRVELSDVRMLPPPYTAPDKSN